MSEQIKPQNEAMNIALESQAGFEPNMHGTEGYIDPNVPLMNREVATELYGIDANVIADLRLGPDSNQFLVLDLGENADTHASITPVISDRRGAGHQEDMINRRRFVIVEGKTGEDGKTHFSTDNLKGMRTGEEVKLGQKHNSDRFSYGDSVSDEHVDLKIEENGLLKIVDTSESGTTVYYNQESNQSQLFQEAQISEPAIVSEQPKFPQHEESQDPADQWWNQEQAQESQELAEHLEIPKDVAEGVGDVAVEASRVIETPVEVSETNIEPEVSIESAQKNVEEAFFDGKPEEGIDESVVEEEAQVEAVDLLKIFSSPEAFEETMANPDVDESIKRDMREINHAWQKIKLARTGSEVWDELIAPRLREVSDTVPQLEKQAGMTLEVMDNMAQGLNHLAQAIDSRDMQNIADVTRRYRFGELTEEMRNGIQKAAHGATLSEVSRRLMTGDWEADERVTKVRKGFQTNASPEMTETVGQYLEQGMNLGQVKDELLNLTKSEGLKSPVNYKDAIENIVRFGRVADQGLDQQSRRVFNELEMMMDNARRGRFDAAEAHQIARMVSQLSQEVEVVQRMARLTRVSAEDINR